ncbi:M48 family metallopeptidase [Candidatus Halocynthiibacter alkanivorans]|uniref:M48 family metallopeptidase n=1 Tax=Candidatus Halocynthiibacter alkanivorans TaxID=2267619 RepID=UPI000DF28B3B|nr:SprT family zinc-dependent metalloprotease [Candidatus Halocynthiibacter alkanivorans]
MAEMILAGNPPYEVALRRSGRCRRLSLRVSRLDGKVTLSLPRWTPETEARAFLRDQDGWIRKHLADSPGAVVPGFGGRMVFRGEDCPIVPGRGRVVRYVNGELHVPGDPELVAIRLQAWLKLQAREVLTEAVEYYSEELGRSYGRLSLRDTRSRWGSCTSEGNLMLSWRLVMAPADVSDYVAAHEVAHLAQMNHSPRFWAVVEQLYPQYQPARQWLRDQGQTLHRYRFD